MRDAFSRLVSKAALPQTTKDEIPFFDDQLLFLSASRTPTTSVLTTPSPPRGGPPPDGVALSTTRASRARHIRGHSMHSLSETPPSPTDVNEFDDVCCDNTDDVDPFDIGRGTGNSSHTHPVLDNLSSSLTFGDVLTAH